MGEKKQDSWVEAVAFLKNGKCSQVWDEKPCRGNLKFFRAVNRNRYFIGCGTCGQTPKELGRWAGVSNQTALRLMLSFRFEDVQSDYPLSEISQPFHKARYEKMLASAGCQTENRKGVATVYNGVQYRSRLEAKWACFFDLLGWPHEYEPFDLDGYIPDFAIMFKKPLLVEVKPVLSLDDVLEKCQKPIVSAWNENRRILIAGGGIGYHGSAESSHGRHTSYNIGWMAYGEDDNDDYDDNNITAAPFAVCPFCKKITTYPLGGFQTCVRCGSDLYGQDLKTPFYEGMYQVQLINMWQKAANAVQYKSPSMTGA
jgi:hypothetical protein